MQNVAQDLRRNIPQYMFKPYSGRLLHFTALFAIGLSSIAAIVLVPMDWYFKLLLGLVIGHCWAITGLLTHEILHGSVVRNRRLQTVLGFIGMAPFMISPTFWRYWHNTLHHSHTQRLIKDPDAYPTYRIFKHSKFVQWMYPFTPGSKHKRSFLYFFFWFSFNVQMAQSYFRFRNKVYDKMNHKQVNLELALVLIPAIAVLAFTGPSNWLWAVIIPFLTQNYIVFSYISTNHNLNPLTAKNEPLVNSLSVTNNPIWEFLHINFGYHVEHHLFPSMNPVYAKTVHRALIKQYPDNYHFMPKWKAIHALYKTARIYKSATELMNPETGETYPTLISRKPQPQVQAPVIPQPEVSQSL